MLSKSLYEIRLEYANIVEELLNLEGGITPEMEFALSINKDELEAKAEGYALRILEFNGQAEMIALEIKRLQARQKQFENTVDHLKANIKAAMIQFQVEKIKTEKVTLSFRKSEVVQVPETFADDILQFVTIKAELDPEKVKSVTEAANSNGVKAPIVPDPEVLQYFKLSATIDKAKMKSDIKDGKTVGDVMVLENKNLQIK